MRRGREAPKISKKWVTSFLDGPEGGITTPIWKIGLIYRWQRKFNSRNTIDLSALIALKVNTFCNTMGCHPTSFSDAFSQMTSLPLLHTAQIGSKNVLKWVFIWVFIVLVNHCDELGGLWNRVSVTRNQCEKWVELKLNKAFIFIFSQIFAIFDDFSKFCCA